MSKRLNAVDKVMDKLFDRRRKQEGSPTAKRNPKRTGGKPGSSSGGFATNRMSRVGGRHGQAIFKLVTTGGTHDRSGLKGQLNYIFRDDKAARIIDPSGTIESHELVTNEQLNKITLAWSNDWWAGTRNGQTSHMILSFPRGVSIDHVTEITRDVCEEKFNTGDARYEYVVAVHDDQEHHPHAHIVLNRRASDNSLFHMRQGTENSYEGFRECMAAHAERRGIYLDPTSRFERGITDRQPTRTEQIEASKEGRAPQQRPRTGDDLDYAKEQISLARIGYEALAVVAQNADCQRLERAYLDVADMLETNGSRFEMPEGSAEEYERFDEYASHLNASLEQIDVMLASRSAAERVPFEVRLGETMRALTGLSPDTAFAKDLHKVANGNSIYMHEFAGKNEHWELAQDLIETIARDVGLDADAIVARLEAGAPNAYVEQMWVYDDMRRVAEAKDLRLDLKSEYDDAFKLLSTANKFLRDGLLTSRIIYPLTRDEAGYANDNGRSQPAQSNRLAHWEVRSAAGYSLTKTAADHHEVMRLLKENTTDAQYNRFRTGDLSAIEHITRDPVFSRQLLVEVEASNRATGFDLTQEQEDCMTAARDHLKGVFAEEFDQDRDYER